MEAKVGRSGAQWKECSVSKHEDPSSVTRSHILKQPGIIAFAEPQLREMETEGSWNLLAGHPTYTSVETASK